MGDGLLVKPIKRAFTSRAGTALLYCQLQEKDKTMVITTFYLIRASTKRRNDYQSKWKTTG